MQESLANSFYSHDTAETTPKDVYLWAAAHTRLCQAFVDEADPKLRIDLTEKIDASLLQGKTLLGTLNEQIQSQNKPCIPISGINRFNRPKELLVSKEMTNKNNHYPYKSELGTSSNLKSMPLPSKTYLKKKMPTQ
ncbi:MAG: hypothetical protein V4591_04750 [Bdellovibrionota bacterium]